MSQFIINRMTTELQSGSIDARDLEKLNEWIDKSNEEGVSHYHGMTYEQGMRDMQEFLMSETKADDIMGG
jgi:hypothetical protein